MSKQAPACALLLRSSKDRHEVSIDAQRRALVALAGAKSLPIAAEFADAVEAANDWDRPAFSKLLLELGRAERGWDTLLVYDTSRIARDVHLAGVFRQECRRRGVKLVFKVIPDTDPLTDLIAGQIYHLLDHIHSHMSREKGRAGMAENVRRGYRAGGVAPYGYSLVPIETGAVRDGEPVTKTRLVANEEAPAIASYLKARATGRPGRQAARAAAVKLSSSSLVDAEWRALTYAGHTVWNQSRSRGFGAGGYEGGTKRRPRAEWLIQRDTHPALITEAEAEAVLARRERGRGVYMRGDAYLLSGLVVDQGGRRWHGDQGFYRRGRRRLSAERLERLVLDAIGRQLTQPGIVAQAVQQARKIAQPTARDGELKTLQRRGADLERKIARMHQLLPETKHPETLMPVIEKLKDEKVEVDRAAAALVDELGGARVYRMVDEDDARRVLAGIVDSMKGLDRAHLKAWLRSAIERIVVDPVDLKSTIYYAIPAATGVSVASPRPAARIPAIRITRRLELYGFRKAA